MNFLSADPLMGAGAAAAGLDPLAQLQQLNLLQNLAQLGGVNASNAHQVGTAAAATAAQSALNGHALAGQGMAPPRASASLVSKKRQSEVPKDQLHLLYESLQDRNKDWEKLDIASGASQAQTNAAGQSASTFQAGVSSENSPVNFLSGPEGGNGGGNPGTGHRDTYENRGFDGMKAGSWYESRENKMPPPPAKPLGILNRANNGSGASASSSPNPNTPMGEAGEPGCGGKNVGTSTGTTSVAGNLHVHQQLQYHQPTAWEHWVPEYQTDREAQEGLKRKYSKGKQMAIFHYTLRNAKKKASENGYSLEYNFHLIETERQMKEAQKKEQSRMIAERQQLVIEFERESSQAWSTGVGGLGNGGMQHHVGKMGGMSTSRGEINFNNGESSRNTTNLGRKPVCAYGTGGKIKMSRALEAGERSVSGSPGNSEKSAAPFEKNEGSEVVVGAGDLVAGAGA
eukprot:g11276.t1